MGLFDMSGNVWEWSWEAYRMQGYAQHTRQDPMWIDDAPYRVIRGGGWKSHATALRCSNRGFELFSTRRPDIGLRLVRVFNRSYSTKPPNREEFLKF